jgi:2-dehydropantoate 2-reductase
MRILVVGAGATGGFFGGRLAQIGRDVTFLVRPARAEQLRTHGLQIVSPLGDATLHAKLLTADELRAAPEPFDLILLATKAYSLASAIDDLAPAVGPDTAILPILNGMLQLDILDARFGSGHVLGGTCRINSDVDSGGRIHQLSKLGEITFGERDYARTPRIEQIQVELSGALFSAILSPDILAAMAHKWCVLSSLNLICLLARGTVGEAVAVPYGLTFANAAIEECTTILTANGYPPDPTLFAAERKRMTQPGSDLTSSMYRDLLKGAPVEADHILGDLLTRAEPHNIAAPLLRAAFVQMKVYEAQRSKT